MTRPSASKVASRFTKRTAAKYDTQILVNEILSFTILDEEDEGEDLEEVTKRVRWAVDDFVKDVIRECAGMVVEEVFIPSVADEEEDYTTFKYRGGTVAFTTTYPSQVALRSSIELDLGHMLSMSLRSGDVTGFQINSDVLDVVDELVVEILSDKNNWKGILRSLDREGELSEENVRELSEGADVTIPIVTTTESYDASGNLAEIPSREPIIKLLTSGLDVLTVNVRGGGVYTLEVSAHVTVNVDF